MTTTDAAGGKKLTRRDILAAGGAAAGALALGVDPVRAATRIRRANPVEVTMFVFLGGALGRDAEGVQGLVRGQALERQDQHLREQQHRRLPADGGGEAAGSHPKPFVNMGFFNAQTAAQGDLDDMWLKLDYAHLENAKDIYPGVQAQQPEGDRHRRRPAGAPLQHAADLEPADVVGRLWNPDYAGKVTFFDYYWQAVYAAARLNGGNLHHMDKGWNLWSSKAHQQIRTIVTSNPQYLQVLTNGTAGLTSYFNGTGLQWMRQGAPLKYVVPKEGAINVPVYLQSVKGNTAGAGRGLPRHHREDAVAEVVRRLGEHEHRGAGQQQGQAAGGVQDAARLQAGDDQPPVEARVGASSRRRSAPGATSGISRSRRSSSADADGRGARGPVDDPALRRPGAAASGSPRRRLALVRARLAGARGDERRLRWHRW